MSAPIRVAAELAPAVWTFAAAERKRDAASRLVAARAIGATGAALGDDIRAFRRTAKLPMDVSVILWPHVGDDGVVPIESRDFAEVSLPKARVVRERVAPLVRAGGLVTDVWLPHECLAGLAAARGLATACVIIAHPGIMCVGFVMNGVVRARYLSSTAPGAISLLAPHVRDMGGAAEGVRVLIAGHLPALRVAMVPLVEELDHEIDVLDADIPAPAPHVLESADADEIAGAQLAWALAALPARTPGAPGQ